VLTRVIADAVAEGLMARAGSNSGDSKPEAGQLAGDEPLPEWETQLLTGATEAPAEAARSASRSRRGSRSAEAAPAAAAAPPAVVRPYDRRRQDDLPAPPSHVQPPGDDTHGHQHR
jgi:small subunit ribosomal protein S2